jgi:hypothetical protein
VRLRQHSAIDGVSSTDDQSRGAYSEGLAQEFAQCRERLWNDAVVSPTPSLLPRKESSLDENLQVMTYGGLAEAEWRGQMAHASLRFPTNTYAPLRNR